MISGDKLSVRIEERAEVIERGITHFVSRYGDFQLIDSASLKIAGVYYQILKKYVRPLVPKNINKFKIAAITAMTIVKLQPIVMRSNEALTVKEKRLYNAKFGYFVGVSIILDMMYPDEDIDKITGINAIDDSMKIIQKQHLKWLELKKLDDFPIFPVAAFYYIFFTMFQTKYNVLMT